MGSGALVQLAAVGQANEYTTINPESTFFKSSYKRHTNFARVPIEQTFNSAIGFGRKMTATVARSGDLITQCYLCVKLSGFVLPNEVDCPDAQCQIAIDPLTDLVYWTNEVGHAMINEIEVDIGGQTIDTWYGQFLAIWENLSHKSGKRLGSLVGFFPSVADLVAFSSRDQVLYVPLMFWFNRCSEQALPVIALQYHEIKFQVKLRPRSELVIYEGAFAGDECTAVQNRNCICGGELTEAFFLINYVYLDTMERRIFATNAHEYLITQLQFTGSEAKQAGKGTFNIQLYFNHICKEFIWVIQRRDAIEANRWFDFSGINPDEDPLISARIQLNAHDLFNRREAIYFRRVVPLECHSQIPDRYIYVFSFALDPENWKPTGGVNLSRIDNVTVNLQTQDFEGEINMYAMSLNVGKIISGMFGIKYAN